MSNKTSRGAQQGKPAPTDWRIYRPAIWLAILGVAVCLLVNPVWIGAAPIGGAIGVALRIRRRQRRGRRN